MNDALGDWAAQVSLPEDVLTTALFGNLHSEDIMLCSSDSTVKAHIGFAGSKDEAHGDWASQDSAAKGLRVSTLRQAQNCEYPQRSIC